MKASIGRTGRLWSTGYIRPTKGGSIEGGDVARGASGASSYIRPTKGGSIVVEGAFVCVGP